GEPLAAWDVIEVLLPKLRGICAAHGTKMSGSVTTNAVLLNESRLGMLANNGVRGFQVTLDGPRDVHDRRRKTARGEGAFDKVWYALEMMKSSSHELATMIRIHFDPSTLGLLVGRSGFVRQIVSSFARNDARFKLHFHALGRWGGPNDEETPVFGSAAAEHA